MRVGKSSKTVGESVENGSLTARLEAIVRSEYPHVEDIDEHDVIVTSLCNFVVLYVAGTRWNKLWVCM